MTSEDHSISNAVRQLKAKHPAISVELAQDIGEAIREERQRCADVAREAAWEYFTDGYEGSNADRIKDAILRGFVS